MCNLCKEEMAVPMRKLRGKCKMKRQRQCKLKRVEEIIFQTSKRKSNRNHQNHSQNWQSAPLHRYGRADTNLKEWGNMKLQRGNHIITSNHSEKSQNFAICAAVSSLWQRRCELKTVGGKCLDRKKFQKGEKISYFQNLH